MTFNEHGLEKMIKKAPEPYEPPADIVSYKVYKDVHDKLEKILAIEPEYRPAHWTFVFDKYTDLFGPKK